MTKWLSGASHCSFPSVGDALPDQQALWHQYLSWTTMRRSARPLRLAFERQPGFTVCGEAEDGFDAIAKPKSCRPI